MSKNTKHVDPVSIGLRIKNIRLELGDTMADFASKIDKKAKSGTVSNWETGKNSPNNNRLKRIADLGGTTVEYLLYGSLENYANTLLDSLKTELNENNSISNTIIPFIVNEVKNALFPQYFKQDFSDIDELENTFAKHKENALERWSDPSKIETNILNLLSETLTSDIQETMPYLYSDYYNTDDPKIKSAAGATDLSELKRRYLSVLDNYQRCGIDILRYNDEKMIVQAIADLETLIKKSPTIFL